MKKIWFSVFVLLLVSSCSWDVLSPTDGELILNTKVNVQVTFIFESESYPDAQEIIVLNENWEHAQVRISRRVDGWGNYNELFNRMVGGRSEISEKVYFGHGDKIELYIHVDNRENDDTEGWEYFQLGKTAIVDTTIVIEL